ncbi:aspartate aminotransferase [Streptococcus pseudoporcinus]|uniref:Aspartate aminotransferase n=1 Tax=Streptococcus pseudoporcinus TaxID=361101 RepID=A0A4V6L4G6_9STRE|nr:aspartate aminotransferase [Streptococcus pseudoporcinus]
MLAFTQQLAAFPELKSAIATYMENFYGYSVAHNQIVAGTGAKFILYAFFMATSTLVIK